MELSKEQKIGLLKIQLRVICQIALETLDDLKETDAYKGPLKTKINDLYQMLDKNTRQYDEMYNITAEGTTAFYQIMNDNVSAMMHLTIPDRNTLNKMLFAHSISPKAIDGIVTKILKDQVFS